MKGFVAVIEDVTEENTDFRRVLYTGKNLQLVLMSLLPGEEIGEEVHTTHDQFFRIEAGKGVLSIDGAQSKIKKDHAVIVPAGARPSTNGTARSVCCSEAMSWTSPSGGARRLAESACRPPRPGRVAYRIEVTSPLLALGNFSSSSGTSGRRSASRLVTARNTITAIGNPGRC